MCDFRSTIITQNIQIKTGILIDHNRIKLRSNFMHRTICIAKISCYRIVTEQK